MADKDSGLEANYTFENGLRNEADTTQTGTAEKTRFRNYSYY